MNYKVFDYSNSTKLNSLIYEMAINNAKLHTPITHIEAAQILSENNKEVYDTKGLNPRNIKHHPGAIKVDGGGVLSSFMIHEYKVKEVNDFFTWIEGILDIKTEMSWIVTYNQHQRGGKHCHMEYDTTFCYYANVPNGSSPLIIEGETIEPVLGRVVVFSGQLEHEVLLSEIDGRCSLVGHGS